MSDFFRPPEPPPEPARAPLQPAWLGPPENEIGVAVALRLLLARTEKVAVALTNITSAGVSDGTGTLRSNQRRLVAPATGSNTFQ